MQKISTLTFLKPFPRKPPCPLLDVMEPMGHIWFSLKMDSLERKNSASKNITHDYVFVFLFIYNESFIERCLQIDQRPFTCIGSSILSTALSLSFSRLKS